ncbi:FAD-dependent oxidoreductase [Pediococcus acidilactici]
MRKEYDVLIVGGGPGGLTAAIYGGRAELKTLLIEKSGYGGRITETAEVKNYPGVELDSGNHLMETFKKHAEDAESVELKRTTVTRVQPVEDGFIVSTKRRGDFTAKTVILDLGTVPRELNISGEKEFVGQGFRTALPATRNFLRTKKFSWLEHVTGSRRKNCG